ncbi:MAG: ABC transporter ATP-binding protein [Elusimicrobiales bacterium]
MSIRRLLKWLSEYWFKHRYRMLFIVILGIISAYIQAAMPFYIKKIINGFEFSMTRDYVIKNVFVLLILGFASFIINLFAQRNRAYMNYRIEYEIRKKTFLHILKLDEFFFYRFSQGDIITRLIDDISEKIAWFSCSGVFRFVQAVFTLIAVISVMFYINPMLSFVALSPMPIMVFVITKLGHKLTKRYDELQKSISQVYEYLETSFGGIKLIRANMKEKMFSKKFEEITNKQMEKSINAERLQALAYYIFFFSSTLGVFLVYVFGGIEVINGKMTVGDLVSFQVYVFMIIWPFSDVSQFFISSKRAGASAQRVNEILIFKPSLTVKHPTKKIEEFEYLRIENLKFSIGEKRIIDGVRIEVRRGEKIAIVGKVGSSKSTLLKIIARLIPYDEGIFEINGYDACFYDINSYYSIIGYVPQESLILSDTIYNNITMYHNYSQEDVKRVVEVVGLDKDLLSMKKDIYTITGTKGWMLSGGQKQRIALARAILKKPKLLILDDATNQIDVKTENQIWDELEKMNLTLIFTTHRTSLLEKADRIYVLEKGKTLECGSHGELILLDSLYTRIYSEYKSK